MTAICDERYAGERVEGRGERGEDTTAAVVVVVVFFFFFQILLEIRVKKAQAPYTFVLCTSFHPSAERRLCVNLAPPV